MVLPGVPRVLPGPPRRMSGQLCGRMRATGTPPRIIRDIRCRSTPSGRRSCLEPAAVADGSVEDDALNSAEHR